MWVDDKCRINDRYRDKVSDYMIEGIERFVNEGILSGDLVTACLENNFTRIMECADMEHKGMLKDISLILVWEIPVNCWGSKEKVLEWQRKKRGT